jgi:hypothetical protein
LGSYGPMLGRMFCAHGLSLCPINGNWQQIVLVTAM